MLTKLASISCSAPPSLPNMVTSGSKKNQDGDGQNPNSRLQNGTPDWKKSKKNAANCEIYKTMFHANSFKSKPSSSNPKPSVFSHHKTCCWKNLYPRGNNWGTCFWNINRTILISAPCQDNIGYWQMYPSDHHVLLCVCVYVVRMSSPRCLQDKFLCIYATWCIKWFWVWL